jgi:hypothetical protein
MIQTILCFVVGGATLAALIAATVMSPPQGEEPASFYLRRARRHVKASGALGAGLGAAAFVMYVCAAALMGPVSSEFIAQETWTGELSVNGTRVCFSSMEEGKRVFMGADAARRTVSEDGNWWWGHNDVRVFESEEARIERGYRRACGWARWSGSWVEQVRVYLPPEQYAQVKAALMDP